MTEARLAFAGISPLLYVQADGSSTSLFQPFAKAPPARQTKIHLALAAPLSGLPPSLRSVRPWLPVGPVLSAFAVRNKTSPTGQPGEKQC